MLHMVNNTSSNMGSLDFVLPLSLGDQKRMPFIREIITMKCDDFQGTSAPHPITRAVMVAFPDF